MGASFDVLAYTIEDMLAELRRSEAVTHLYQDVYAAMRDSRVNGAQLKVEISVEAAEKLFHPLCDPPVPTRIEEER